MPLKVSAGMEGYGTVLDSNETLSLIGVDMIAEASRYGDAGAAEAKPTEASVKQLEEPTSVWVGRSLKKKPGDQISLLINDEPQTCTVRGVYDDSNGNDSAIVMDLAGAERTLKRKGRVDRILLKLRETVNTE